MVGLVVMLRRFLRAIRDAWKSDEAFRTLLALVVSLLVSGTTFFTLVEGWSVLDSFYFSVTTLTTVGFGDPAPATAAGKIFTILYIFVGLGVIGGFINVWRRIPSPDRGDERASVKIRSARMKTRRALPAARGAP